MITSEIAESIESSILCWFATVAKDGSPNLSPKEAFTHDGQGILAVIEVEPREIEEIIAPSYRFFPGTTTFQMIQQSLLTYKVVEYQERVANSCQPDAD